MIDTALFRSIEQGPYKHVTLTPEGPVDTPVEDYGKKNKTMIYEDQRAYGILSACLLANIAQTLTEETSSKGLWDSLVEIFDENLEMRNNRKEMFKGEFNILIMFKGNLLEIS